MHSSPRSDFLSGLVFLSTLLALVVLHLTEHSAGTTDVITLAGPVVAALFLASRLDARHEETKQHLTRQEETLNKVNEQTNGILDQRIRDGVRDGLKAYASTVPLPERNPE